MDMAAAYTNINWLSVVVAALTAFLVGGLWYGPLFGNAWMAAFGLSPEDLAQRSMARVFGLSACLSLIAATNLELFIGSTATAAFGATAGFFAGLGWVATLLGILYLFEMRSMRAYLINAGYCVVSLTVMGLVLGAW